MDTFTDIRYAACDKCGPSVGAALIVIVTTGELAFCAHCARAYRQGLGDAGALIQSAVPAYDVTTGYVVDNFKSPDQELVSTGACTAE
jgi:hypothetical protein